MITNPHEDYLTMPLDLSVPPTGLIPTYLGAPMLPPVGRTIYVRRSRRTRLARYIRANGVTIGLCAPAPVVLAYAIATLVGAQ